MRILFALHQHVEGRSTVTVCRSGPWVFEVHFSCYEVGCLGTDPTDVDLISIELLLRLL